MIDPSLFESKDASLMRLPHPARLDAIQMLEISRQLWSEEYEVLRQIAGNPLVTTEELLNVMATYPVFSQMAAASLNNPAGRNLGMFDSLITPMRLKELGGRFFQTRDALESSLEATDVGDKAPCAFMRPPYPAMFIEFGETRQPERSIGLLNPVSGWHGLEGVYVLSFEVKPEHPYQTPKAKALGIHTYEPYRVIELTFTGTPVGHGHVTDDASEHVVLLLQDEAESVADMLERHFSYYSSEDGRLMGDPLSPQQVDIYRTLITHFAKVLLYINSEQVVREQIKERSELEERIRKVKAGKRKKLERKFSRTYDRIVIGSKQQGLHVENSPSESRTTKTHWRRGHFRQQRYGEGYSKSKLIWIEPVLVNPGDAIKSKVYTVR